MRTYLDTSVLAAYYCPEALSTAAEKAILHSEEPAISQLVEVELVSVVARKVREGMLAITDATRIVSQFRLHVDGVCYERLLLDFSHYQIARDWLGQFGVPLRTLDALHILPSVSPTKPFYSPPIAGSQWRREPSAFPSNCWSLG